MKKISGGMFKLILLLCVILFIFGECKTARFTNVETMSNKEVLIEGEDERKLKVIYTLLDGEDRVVFNVIPGQTYKMDYELRLDEGVFDIKIISGGNNLLYKFPYTSENSHISEIEQNANLHIIGGTIKISSDDENIIVLISGTSATGYLKLNLE